MLGLTSCQKDFLDRSPLDALSKNSFWKTESDVVYAVNGCYSGWESADRILYMDCATDNAFGQFPWEGYQVLGNGNVTAADAGASIYSYTNIARCNMVLENIGNVPMSDDMKKRYSAEVRFIRAYTYYNMLFVYGDVPLITKTVTIEESKAERTPRATVLKFVMDELTACIDGLPTSYSDSKDKGRITKGAALAIRARIELAEKQYDACATDCQAIMGLGYQLFPDYRKLFNIDNKNNSEVVLDVQYKADNGGFENWVLGVLLPNSQGGWSSITPTQSLVDEYECTDGKTIAESPLYDSENPYANRDPRFYATVIYPGALYEGSYFDPLNVNSDDYYTKGNTSKTGYNFRKYVDSPSQYKDVWNTGMNAMVVRYAEVLLMYAEAMVEQNKIDASVYKAIDDVRTRAGMPKVDQAVYSNQSKLRELIRRERRVEFAQEGLRFFDIVRWRISEVVMNQAAYGIRQEGSVDSNTGKVTFTTQTRLKAEDRHFDPAKNYLWPIPQAELDKNPNLKQNPGY
jgi:SusD family.